VQKQKILFNFIERNATVTPVLWQRIRQSARENGIAPINLLGVIVYFQLYDGHSVPEISTASQELGLSETEFTTIIKCMKTGKWVVSDEETAILKNPDSEISTSRPKQVIFFDTPFPEILKAWTILKSRPTKEIIKKVLKLYGSEPISCRLPDIVCGFFIELRPESTFDCLILELRRSIRDIEYASLIWETQDRPKLKNLHKKINECYTAWRKRGAGAHWEGDYYRVAGMVIDGFSPSDFEQNTSRGQNLHDFESSLRRRGAGTLRINTSYLMTAHE